MSLELINQLQEQNAALRERVAKLKTVLADAHQWLTIHFAEAAGMDKHDYSQMAAFVDKVQRMRGFQREYFRTRAQGMLVCAKQLEAEVDNTIANDIYFIELLKSYKPVCFNK